MRNPTRGAEPSGALRECHWTHSLVSVLFAVCMTLVFVEQIAYAFETVDSAAILSLPAVFMVLLHLYYTFKKDTVSDHGFALMSLTLCILIRIILLVTVKTVAVSDFEEMYTAAVKAAGGDRSWLELGYYQRFPHQIPFVLYEAVILKLFGGRVGALKLFNAIWEVGSVILMYLIARHYCSDRKATAVASLYALLPTSFCMTTVLTNQHPAMFLILLGLYLYTLAGKKQGTRNRLLLFLSAGVSWGLSNLIRGETILVVLAVAAVQIIALISKKDRFRNVFPCLLTVTASYFAIQKGIAGLLQWMNYAPHGVGNPYWVWKFVVGLNFSGNGAYSSENAYIFGITDSKERVSEMLRIIRSSYTGPGNLWDFFKNKIRLFWCKDDIWGWALHGVQYNPLVINSLKQLESIYRCVLYGVCTVFGFRTVKTKSEYTLIKLLFLAVFLVFLLIEVQPRYRYFADPFVFLLLCGAEIRFPKKKTDARAEDSLSPTKSDR